MFELIPLGVAFIGSSLAAIWDLKTTEIPDGIPYVMIAIGLIFHGIQSLLQWSYWPILNSLTFGLGFLGFGFLMYYGGQWGGGDAKVLSAIGFLLPVLPQGFPELFFPFPLSYMINVFVVGAAYMLIYAFVLALINKKIMRKFLKDMKASSKLMLILLTFSLFIFIFLNWFFIYYFQIGFDFVFILKNSFFPLIAILALFVIWKFTKSVEEIGFKKRIPVSKLKVGDVLLESKKWEGITKKELKKIRKSRKFVTVKEGVRFAPSFPLALLFTLYLGDGLLIFMNFLI